MSRFPSAPDISVVIPVLDGADTIAVQLDALARQRTTCTWELVVADNGSTDGTAEVVQAHPLGETVDVRIVDASAAKGVNVARNVGAAAATGHLLLFCDADDRVGDDWIESYRSALRVGGAVAAGGPLDRWTDADERVGRGVTLTAPAEVAPGFVTAWGSNMAFSRDVWQLLGGFDEGFRGGYDEVDLFARAFLQGVPFVWVEGARVRYRGHPLHSALQKYFRIGRNSVHFERKHPSLVAPNWSWPRLPLQLMASVTRSVADVVRGRNGVRHLGRAAFLSGVATERLRTRTR